MPDRPSSRSSPASGRPTKAPGYRPLYRQAYDLLAVRIHKGTWRPAEALPSEQALAAELGVSHGTVRKALDALVADKLLQRRQGKGTFVVEQTAEQALFQFFRICDRDGKRATPTSSNATVVRRPATRLEAKRLELKPKSDVYAIGRVRSVDQTPLIRETLVVSVDRFPDLDQRKPLPNTIYVLYQQAYGALVTEAQEQVIAVAATATDAKVLNVAKGTPLLKVERIALDHQKNPLELRMSFVRTDSLSYSVSLK